MPSVELSALDYERLKLVAATLGESPGAAVGALLDRLQQSVADEGTGQAPEAVPIHVIYKGKRVEAEFRPATESVTVMSGPLAGQQFNSPSRAAIEVVRSINPDVHPNRNGWGFWIVTATGRELQSIRGR